MSRALVPLKPPARPDLEQGDFAVSIKVRNGLFLTALRRRGYRSVNAFCKAHGLPQRCINSFVTMTLSPIKRDGQPSAIAQAAADILETRVEDLFPPQFYSRCLSRIARADDVPMTEDQIGMLLQQPPRTPDDVIAFDEAARDISNTLIMLPPRIERLLRLRHGMGVREEETFDQIGERFDIGRGRAQQIEAKGLRMLKHPSRSRHLFEAAKTLLGVGIFRVSVPAKRKHQPPKPEVPEVDQQNQSQLRRKVKFPQPKGEPAYIVLLRTPPDERNDEHKRRLAYELERELVSRGASPMTPTDDATRIWLAKQSAVQIELAKYQWLMKNLADLWVAFPPEPRL